ncbi:MAG: arginine--tRNA ligase [Candidatus Marinimicrobia bacterium]|nr:arginine--tRNA ligase [Candidatus Neomarinimicrobiota bacterium]
MKELLSKALSEASAKLGYKIPPSEIGLEKPKNRSHGDLSSNLALLLAGKSKQKPLVVANNLKENISLDEKIIEKIEVAPPGFLNFTYGSGYRTEVIETILSEKSNYGRSSVGKNKTVNVEFVSANPTGPLNIGHGRNAVIGDCVARILEFNGFDVTREYYFNNAGRQMRLLGETVRYHYLTKLEKKTSFPVDGYEGEYLAEIAEQLIEEKGDTLVDSEDVSPFKEIAERVVFEDIKLTLANIGIRMDKYFNEDDLYNSGAIESVLKRFYEKGLAYDKDGAVWLRLTELGMGEDRVIKKSSGEPTYRLPDIAYHEDKLNRNYDLIIDILGADHHASFPDVVAGVKALGYDAEKINILLHQFVTLTKDGKKIKMSTRKANYVTLDELQTEVGEDVLRYFFLMRSVNSHLNFEMDLAKKETDENPVYYIQYAHARISSIIRLAAERDENYHEPDLSLLNSGEEKALITFLGEFPEMVEKLHSMLQPHLLTVFLSELATLFSRFYTEHKVVSDDHEITASRLALCITTAAVIRNGLGLLGISAPESM